MRFEFASPRVVFGEGAVADVAALARDLGRRAVVVTGRSAERAGRLCTLLAAAGIETIILNVAGEPDVDVVRRGSEIARASDGDVIFAIGGGSAIDAAKAIAALATNPGDPLDYLEVVGRGRPLTTAPLPVVAIPTTAGTGSEATKNAVIGVPEHAVKVSLRAAGMLPRLAIVDPELTYDLPPDVTARTGLDALTQLIEPYVSSRANPMTDALALRGLRLGAPALRRVSRDGSDHDARRDMALASVLGGLCLANAGLGAVHGFAGPIGGMFPAPHGAVCAALLPHVVAGNIRALETRVPEHPALGRLDDIARTLTGDARASRYDAEIWLEQIVSDLAIPRLRDYGMTAKHVEVVVEKAARASSMKANPIPLTFDELSAILASAI